MKTIILSLTLLCYGMSAVYAQVTEKQLQKFVPKGYKLADTSGDGLKNASGDILLKLVFNEPDSYETLMLLHNNKGKLTKIAENSSLLMGKEMLGNSGGNYPSLSGTILSVDYSLGSGSALSDISIKFERKKDGQYQFVSYTSTTTNHGVEDLTARQQITAAQTGIISFAEATEDLILKNTESTPESQSEPIYKIQNKYANYIPEGFQLAAATTGDLNLDGLKNDVVLVVYDGQECVIQLMLQQSNGTYKIAQNNNKLIAEDKTFNPNNLNVVIKKGYFTVEQLMPTSDIEFEKRYITFKYNTAQKNWLLHRYGVEYYSGFNPKPSKDVTHLTTKEFGKITFYDIQNPPGVYLFEPATSIISGTLSKKMFYEQPNYGETPEIDEKVWVYILKPDYPVNVYGDIDPEDPETADDTETNITEIQVYSLDKTLDIKKHENKKVKLQGVFQSSLNGHHHTKVLMEIKKIL